MARTLFIVYCDVRVDIALTLMVPTLQQGGQNILRQIRNLILLNCGLMGRYCSSFCGDSVVHAVSY